MFVAIKIFEISLNNLILKPKQELIVGFKVKEKYYVHNFFTTPSQQSINDKLLLVVMSGQNSNLSYIFKWEPKTTYHLYFYCETFERILITSKQWTKVFFFWFPTVFTGSFTLRPGGSNEPSDLAQTKFLYIKFLNFFSFWHLKIKIWTP